MSLENKHRQLAIAAKAMHQALTVLAWGVRVAVVWCFGALSIFACAWAEKHKPTTRPLTHQQCHRVRDNCSLQGHRNTLWAAAAM